MLVEKDYFIAFEKNYMAAMVLTARFTPCAPKAFTGTDDLFYFRKISNFIDALLFFVHKFTPFLKNFFCL